MHNHSFLPHRHSPYIWCSIYTVNQSCWWYRQPHTTHIRPIDLLYHYFHMPKSSQSQYSLLCSISQLSHNISPLVHLFISHLIHAHYSHILLKHLIFITFNFFLCHFHIPFSSPIRVGTTSYHLLIAFIPSNLQQNIQLIPLSPSSFINSRSQPLSTI